MNSRSAEPASQTGTVPFSPYFTYRQVIFGTLAVLLVALGFWLLYRFWVVAFSLFEAIVISTAISPAVDWLHRRGMSRSLGVILVYVALLLLLLSFLLLVAPLIVDQGARVASSYSDYYQNFRDRLLASPSWLIQRLAWQLPIRVSPDPDSAAETLDAVARVLSYGSTFGRSVFILIAVLLLAFYWTLERERALRSLLLLVPSAKRDGIREFITAAEMRVGGYVRGLAVLSLTVGSLALVAYLLIGLPYALLLGITAGLLEAAPVIGPALGALPALLVALSSSPAQVVGVIAVNALIQLFENIVLVPRVMGKAVGVNPLVALLALAAFGSLFGLPGALLAIPMAAVIQLLLDRFVLGPQALDQQPPPGRDHLSLLRYQAQELVQDVRKQAREKDLDHDEASDQVEDSIEAIANDLDSILAQVSSPEPDEGRQ
ncbi:MAG: AI-2E family transporter [Anaerolineales bacterium]